MISVCFYFQVHQPFRLRPDYRYFNIGRDHDYEDDRANCHIMRKVADKCYLPTNRLMLDLIRKTDGRFRIRYSITGTAIEQFRMYCPEVLDSFRALVDTGCVELIGETYYHSLAFLFSRPEFAEQVALHKRTIEQEFGVRPTTFRNTELIYNNELAHEVERLGFDAVIAEGTERSLQWRSPNFVYQPAPCRKTKLLLKNYRLSDDLAFRFSDRNWAGWPLTADKFASWLHQVAGGGETVNLFMDYETFGEHQWEETGIFECLRHLPEAVLQHPDFRFHTPAEVARLHPPVAKLDVPFITSWADAERDVTAWLGNPMQDASAEAIYALEQAVKRSGDVQLIGTWRRLLTSDHFYYMCTKFFSDGDVHKYFNPYKTPYDAFVIYNNVLADLRDQLERKGLLELTADDHRKIAV